MEYVLGSKEAVENWWSSGYQQAPMMFRRSERSSCQDEKWPPLRLPELQEMWVNAARSEDSNAVLTFRDGNQTDVKTPFFAYPHDCSVVVNKADRFSRPVFALCERLQQAFPFVFCNVYLTPSGSQTVRAHSDDREVLAIQIMGRKHWTVYGNPPIPHPYRAEEVGKANTVDTSKLPVLYEGTIEAGDVLYVPKGFVHQARTPADAPSLHLTMAIQTSDWDMGALIRDAVSVATRELATCSDSRRELSRDAMQLSAATRLSPSAGALDLPMNDVQAFNQALAQVMNRARDGVLGFHVFSERLEQMRATRRQTIREDLIPVPNPVSLETTVLWSKGVRILSMEEATSDTISSVSHLVVLERGGGGAMPLSLSAKTKRALLMLYERHQSIPVEVQNVPLPCPLARMAFAAWLLRNGCLTRVR